MSLRNILYFLLPLTVEVCCGQKPGTTTIATWQYGRPAALSLTYDDGTINQFTAALPIMNRLRLPATFFIITGQIPGSKYQGRFIGRPVEEIIAETAVTPTNRENFFERASAIAFSGHEGTLEYHTRAGGTYDEQGEEKATEAYKILDEGYAKIRAGNFRAASTEDTRHGVTWDQIKSYAAQGHEFASHTVTHPRLAVLDEVNMLYELEKSKEEIQTRLGRKHTFSAEGPYGTENERAVSYILKLYPASRNRMPEPYLEELNRWNRMNPGTSGKEYVQWQRGATTKTPLPLMKSWVDTIAANHNNWLVLVFHGVDGIGYEALPHELLEDYFNYIKEKEHLVWVATFGDVTKYMRERMAGTVRQTSSESKITVELTHTLDREDYDLPLTLKTYVPAKWKKVKIKQGTTSEILPSAQDEQGSFVQYQAIPNATPIQLTPTP